MISGPGSRIQNAAMQGDIMEIESIERHSLFLSPLKIWIVVYVTETQLTLQWAVTLRAMLSGSESRATEARHVTVDKVCTTLDRIKERKLGKCWQHKQYNIKQRDTEQFVKPSG
jgi:hypothetical protein